MFFLPRLATLWGPYLYPLPRWMLANTLKESALNIQHLGQYPPNVSQPVSYFYGTAGTTGYTPSTSGYGPTWGPLAGPFIAVGVGNNPPDVLQRDSLLVRIFTCLWPILNHVEYEQELLEDFRNCQSPMLGIEDSIWCLSEISPNRVSSVETYYASAWHVIPEALSLYDEMWRSTPGWILTKKGIILSGIEYMEDWAYSDPPYLRLPDADDWISDTSVWLQHPRTSQWLKIASEQIDEDGNIDITWETDTPLPKVRWLSISLNNEFITGSARVNYYNLAEETTTESAVFSLSKIPLWNMFDELAIMFGVERKSEETNRELFDRISYQAGTFKGQTNRLVAMYLANQFGYLTYGPVLNTTSSCSISSPYFLLPELAKEKYVWEQLTPTDDDQLFYTKYADPSYTLFTKEGTILSATLSSGLVDVATELLPDSIVNASLLVPNWTQSSSSINFFTENILEDEYDLFLAEEIDVVLYQNKQKERKWTTTSEEETPFNGLATFD